MKTLCVAVVVLSLTSVCRPASLACKKLLKPEDKALDLAGTWYLIAMSSEYCLVTTILNALFWPSVRVDVTAKDTPNVYDATHKIKMYAFCNTDSEPFLHQNNSLFDIDRDNTPSGDPDVLLQTGCPDCFVVKGDEIIETLMLYSRRQTVTAAELKEFETQTECLGWSKPQVLNTDHDYENCTQNDDDDIDALGLTGMIYQRLKTTYTEPLKCLVENVLYYPRAAFETAQKELAEIW